MIDDFLDVEEIKTKKPKRKEGVVHYFRDELNVKPEDLKLNIKFSEGKSIQDVEVIYYEK